MTWIDLRPGWRDDLAVTSQALGLQWPILQATHAPPCPQPAAIVSATRFAEVVDRCTCSSLRLRPVRL